MTSFDERLETEQNQQIRAKDNHEKVNDMLLEFLKIAMMHMIRREYEVAYRAYNQIQEIIIVKQFRARPDLLRASDVIDEYFRKINERGAKPDMKQILEYNNNKIILQDLIEDYSRNIKIALDEIGLLLKSQEERDFDKQCSEENFGTDESLLNDKREKLLSVTTEKIIKLLTPNQINDVFSRFLTYNEAWGLKID